jgi:hypothetical protein
MEWALFILALLAGAALRFYALGEAPYGLYRDEAFYGLDAVEVVKGARPIFFPANNGREPAYIYLLSLSVAAFGRTAFGLRFASAVIGTLTIAVTYLLGRALFNRRVGLLAMWTCAIMFWPVALSRVSFRAGALPLFLGLAIALGWSGVKGRKVWLALLGGIAYGLAFNTYTASRVTPLALALFIGIVSWQSRKNIAHELREFHEGKFFIRAIRVIRGKEIIAFLCATAISVAPLALYALAHPEQVFAREGQVSIFETEAGNPILILLRHIWLAVGMFGWGGDTIPRHNLPGRPVFDLWTFVFFVIGLGVMMYRAQSGRGRPASRPGANTQGADTQGADTQVRPYRFVLIWLAVTILPTVLAEDTPHFLRGIGLLPVLWLVPAVGVDLVTTNLTGFLNPVRFVVVALILITSTLATIYDYFVRYRDDPRTGFAFESAATELAEQINSRPGFSHRIDDRLWDNFASLRFLIPEREGGGTADRVQLALWPHEPKSVRTAVAALPANSQLSAMRGAQAKGDLESTPYSLYSLFVAEPAQAQPVRATFGGLIELRAPEVTESGEQVTVRLRWARAGEAPITTDYRLYVHVLINGEIAAQHDGEPLDGLYHFSWLRPGDVLNDEYTLPNGGDQILVGLYAPDGTPLGEAVQLK